MVGFGTNHGCRSIFDLEIQPYCGWYSTSGPLRVPRLKINHVLGDPPPANSQHGNRLNLEKKTMDPRRLHILHVLESHYGQ